VISWSARIAAVAAVAVLSLSVFGPSTARAGGIEVDSCVGSRYSITCVSRWGGYGDPYIRQVAPATEAEKAQQADHHRKWQKRCQPLVCQDPCGVPRYEYAAPGCEFGVIQ
jgi:hypothetical protein